MRYINSGKNIGDFVTVKDTISEGKKLFDDDFVKKGTVVCNKREYTAPLTDEQNAKVIGYTTERDRLCKTHGASEMVAYMKMCGQLSEKFFSYYADEIEEGKNTFLETFKRDGFMKTCRIHLMLEDRGKKVYAVLKAIGVFEMYKQRCE